MQSKLRKSVLTFFAVGLLLFGCEKKKDPIKNYFSINGTEYNLSSGYLDSFGYNSDDESYNLDLYLLSDGFNITEKNGEFDDFEGIGEVVYVEMFTVEEELGSGTYVYQEGFGAGTFDFGFVGLRFDEEEEEAGQGFEITGGTITVQKELDIYSISLTLDLIDENEEPSTLKGSYTGNLSKLDFGNITAVRNSRVAKNSKEEKLNVFKTSKK